MEHCRLQTIARKAISGFIGALMALFLLTGVLPVAHATNYYVDSANGNNNFAGTSQGAAWKTLARAVSAVVPGDTVYCKGTFVEQLEILNKGSASNSGWITFINQSGNRPLIAPTTNSSDPNARYTNAVDIKNCFRVRIQGFEIVIHRDYASDGSGVAAYHSNYVTLHDNFVHDCGQSGIQTLRCGYVTVENNACWNNCWTGIYDGSGISLYENYDYPNTLSAAPADPRQYQNVVRSNRCWNNYTSSSVDPVTEPHTDGNGIIIDDGRQTQDFLYMDPNTRLNVDQKGGTLVENNACWNNGGRGVNIFASAYTLVQNNTCYNNCSDPQIHSGEFTVGGSLNTTLRNNIGYARTNLWALQSDALSGSAAPVLQNNMFFNGGASTTEGRPLALDTAGLLGDPKFVSLSTPNFNLQSASSAIDAGVSTNGVGYDLVYHTRSGLYDLGAYESAYTRSNPAPQSFNTYIEAESASNQNNPTSYFAVGNDGGASGGKYFGPNGNTFEVWNVWQYYDALNNSSQTAYATHRAQYSFTLSVRQPVKIWFRVRRPILSSGSRFFAGLDMGGTNARGMLELLETTQGNTSWHWILYRQAIVPSGTHTIKLAKSTNNVQIDQILVTSNLTFTPQ